MKCPNGNHPRTATGKNFAGSQEGGGKVPPRALWVSGLTPADQTTVQGRRGRQGPLGLQRARGAVRGSGPHCKQVAGAVRRIQVAGAAGGPPGVAREPRLPGRPTGASGRRGALRSRAVAGVAGRELGGGVAPRAAREPGRSWGGQRWRWRCGVRAARTASTPSAGS